MVTVKRAREFAQRIALSVALLVLPTLVDDAVAKQRTPAPDRDSHSDRVLKNDWRPVLKDPASDASAAPARHFTINQVLAKEQGASDPASRIAAIDQNNSATDAGRGPTRSSSDAPFGMTSFRAPEGALWVKWRGLEAGLSEEAEQLAKCRADQSACRAPDIAFLSLVGEARERTGREQVDHINRTVNAAIRYTSDLAQHGELDRWTPPLRTLASGRGDCEDYAAAKYVALREAGVARDDMKLVLVRDLAVRQDHAVLAVRLGDGWVMLDNRHDSIIQDTALKHFMPLFVLDRHGVALFAAPYPGSVLEGNFPSPGATESAPTTIGDYSL